MICLDCLEQFNDEFEECPFCKSRLVPYVDFTYDNEENIIGMIDEVDDERTDNGQ